RTNFHLRLLTKPSTITLSVKCFLILLQALIAAWPLFAGSEWCDFRDFPSLLCVS
ncbi:hypothetical protein X975_07304, partial [Stegodyphus mimosarum]